MRVLFVYQYLTYGGVESVLRNRYFGLKKLDPSIEFESLFLHRLADSGCTFGDEVHVSNDGGEIQRLCARADLVSIIDTPQVFGIVEELGKPAIVEVHTPYAENRTYLRRPLPASTRLILTPSLAFKRLVERELAERRYPIEHLHNPLDPAFFDSSGQAVDFVHPGRFRPIFWVGRLDALKDWQAALRVASAIPQAEALRDVELFMVGQHGEPAGPLKAFRQHGLLGRVRYLPSVDFKWMASLYRMVANNHGVYLSTSRGESFGMTAVEAMASGLPCVLNRLEVFEEVTGKKARMFSNEREAVRELRGLLEDREEWNRLSLEAKRFAGRYHPDCLAEGFRDLLVKALR